MKRMLTLAALLSACASPDPTGFRQSDRPPTPAEIAECEAQGGTIEHIRGIHTWACYTSETPVR